MIKQKALRSRSETASPKPKIDCAAVGGTSLDRKERVGGTDCCLGDSDGGRGPNRVRDESRCTDDERGALRGVLESLVVLATEEEGVFRKIIMFM